MRLTSRTAIATGSQRDAFVAAVEDLVPLLRSRAETLALYLLIVAFWGLILYEAATSTLP